MTFAGKTVSGLMGVLQTTLIELRNAPIGAQIQFGLQKSFPSTFWTLKLPS